MAESVNGGSQRCEAAPRQDPKAPAISDYALIGDCRTAALVSLHGSVDWLCLPNFSGPSVFVRLLDPHGGSFSLHPSEPFTATRRYVDGTAVLETTFETEAGCAQILDCLPVSHSSVSFGGHLIEPEFPTVSLVGQNF